MNKKNNGRDTKNRILRSGETQEINGRYRYTYYINGKQHCIYSWRLEEVDRLPKGKRPCVALRTQIKELNDALDKGIAYRGNGMSVLDLVEKYLAIQNANKNIRTSTKEGYRTALGHIKKSDFSSRRIDKVKKSDATLWMMQLSESGLGYSTITTIHGVVKPAFEMAVEENLILRNPFTFVLKKYIVDDSKPREALSDGEKASLLDFIKNDKYYSQYYDAIVFLFETGIRIGELCGLTNDHIDMERRTITIDCQLHRNRDGYYVGAPKTQQGYRTLPLSDMAYESLKNLMACRSKKQEEVEICGKSGFLCFGRDNSPRYGTQWDKVFNNIWNKYKKSHECECEIFTPHICRHTFATTMARKGMNPAMLKGLLGHSDISTTYKIYTHLKTSDTRDEMIRLGLVSSPTTEKMAKIIEFKSKIA